MNLYESIKKESNSNKIDFKNSGNTKLRNYCKRGVNSLCRDFNAAVTYEDAEFFIKHGFQEALDIGIKINNKLLNYSLLLPTWRRLSGFGHEVNKVYFHTNLRRNNKEIKGFNCYAFDSDKDIIDYLFNLIRDDLSKEV